MTDKQVEPRGVAGTVAGDPDDLAQEPRVLTGRYRLLFCVHFLRDNVATSVNDGIDLDKGLGREGREGREAREAGHAVTLKVRGAGDLDRQNLPHATLHLE